MLKLGNTKSWQLIYQNSYRKNTTKVRNIQNQEVAFDSIPDIIIPIKFSSQIIAIWGKTHEGKQTWNLAGYLQQALRTGVSASLNDDSIISSQRFWLNQISILKFPLDVEDFSIFIKPVVWLPDLSIMLWVFNGDTRTITEKKLDSLEDLIRGRNVSE
ncbi:MAG: hypothetical protein AB4062_19750 [Crocosphaera sp.]